jgi:teichuronic acid biosynthesis glycosyltransferase TuaC
MRVLVVTNMYPTPEWPERGIFVRSQIEALRRTGEVEVTVAAFSASGRPWEYGLQAARLARSNEQADIIHAHYGLSGIAALGAAARRRRPLVLTVHGRDCHHPLVRPITALVARRCAAVVAVSRELAGICPFPTADVIPAGVDLTRFRPMDRVEARRRLALPVDERFLLFPADPQRPEKRYDRAAALASALGVTLRSYEHTPTELVPLLINAADAVVVTSEREGYGLACMEALACDVPVLSTPVGIAREVLPGVGETLCAPFDVDTWGAHAHTLLAHKDPHVVGRVAVACHSTDVMARRSLALYREVLRRAGSR